MGITRDELYGAAAAAAPLDAIATAQTARFSVPRGTTPPAPFTAPFRIEAIQVDNASGQWYLVNGRRVPPWTVSAVLRPDAATSQLSVTAVTPSGQLSEAAGEDLVLVATDALLAPAAGIYAPPAQVFSMTRSALIAVVVGGADVIGLAGVAGIRHGLLQLTASGSFSGQPGGFVRALVVIELYEVGGPRMFLACLSPSQPSVTTQWPPGLNVQSIAGANLMLSAYVPSEDLPLGDLTVQLGSYRVAAA